MLRLIRCHATYAYINSFDIYCHDNSNSSTSASTSTNNNSKNTPYTTNEQIWFSHLSLLPHDFHDSLFSIFSSSSLSLSLFFCLSLSYFGWLHWLWYSLRRMMILGTWFAWGTKTNQSMRISLQSHIHHCWNWKLCERLKLNNIIHEKRYHHCRHLIIFIS